MPFDGYTGDYNWSNYTPIDSTGSNYDLFNSAYVNVRFQVQPTTQYQITKTDMANLPGMAYRFFGDTSLWRALMRYNGLSDPISQIAVGLVLNVPTKSDLLAYISQQANNGNTAITI